MTVLTVHACTAHSCRNMQAAVETMKQSCRSKELGSEKGSKKYVAAVERITSDYC